MVAMDVLCAGKISGFIATIPQVIAAGLLLFMWTMLAALGLSNLRYSQTGSSRNVLIVGLSLFLALSIPSYFQQYSSLAGNSTLPSYFQPYNIGAHGPIQTKYPKVRMCVGLVTPFFNSTRVLCTLRILHMSIPLGYMY